MGRRGSVENIMSGIYQQFMSIFHGSAKAVTPTPSEPCESSINGEAGQCEQEYSTVMDQKNINIMDTSTDNIKENTLKDGLHKPIENTKLNQLNQMQVGSPDVTEELIFESIENGNGSDYGSCEERDPVYEEVETEEEIYADCSIKNVVHSQNLENQRSSEERSSPCGSTRSPIDSSITSDFSSTDMLASPSASSASNYEHTNSALSDPECDADIILKCDDPEEEDDLLVHEIDRTSSSGSSSACLKDLKISESDIDINDDNDDDLVLDKKDEIKPVEKKPIVTLRPPMNLDPKKLMPQALKPISQEETIIAREIRLQKEREEEIARERELARKKAVEKIGSLANSSSNLSVIEDTQQQTTVAAPLKPVKPVVASKKPVTASLSSPICTILKRPQLPEPTPVKDNGAQKIADEIRQLKEREDELRKLREKLQAQQEAACNGTSYHSSSHNLSDKSPSRSSSAASNPIQKTPLGGRRNITVRPLDDGDEIPQTTAYLNESPIEREIRLAKERDEALRREKGLLSGKRDVDESPILAERSPSSSSSTSSTFGRSSRSPVKITATSKIQQEIEEQTRRENDLKASGIIRTTSVERIDSKITRMSSVDSDSAVSLTSPIETPTRARTFSSSSSSSGLSNVAPASYKRPAFGAPMVTGNGRGVSMQKFIASKGKEFMLTKPLEPMWIDKPSLESVRAERKISLGALSGSRKGLVTAETKIQQELKLFKERENELRRMRKLGGSQPNMSTLVVAGDIELSSSDNEEDEQPSNGLYPSLKQRVLSNPNLLDCSDDLKPIEINCPVVRRKSAMVAEWERRIQQTQQ